MSKQVKQDKLTKNIKLKKIASYAVYGGLAIGLGMLMSEVALADKLLDSVKKGAKPVTDLARAWYAVPTGLGAIYYAIFGQGPDMGSRAKVAAGGFAGLIVFVESILAYTME